MLGRKIDADFYFYFIKSEVALRDFIQHNGEPNYHVIIFKSHPRLDKVLLQTYGLALIAINEQQGNLKSIEASNAKEFLEALCDLSGQPSSNTEIAGIEFILLKSEDEANYAPAIVDLEQLNDLLKQLEFHGYITSSQRTDYYNRMLTLPNLAAQGARTIKYRNFSSAVYLANMTDVDIQKSGDDQLGWLAFAAEINPGFADRIDITTILNSKTKLRNAGFFLAIADIRSVLRQNTTIDTLDFGLNPYLNEHIAHFIAYSKSIKNLFLSCYHSGCSRLYEKDISLLGYFLRHNTSIEELALNGHWLKDNSLIILLDALRHNRSNKIRHINFYRNSFTNIGGKALIDHLKTYTELEVVELECPAIKNDTMGQEYKDEIVKLTEQNKLANQGARNDKCQTGEALNRNRVFTIQTDVVQQQPPKHSKNPAAKISVDWVGGCFLTHKLFDTMFQHLMHSHPFLSFNINYSMD